MTQNQNMIASILMIGAIFIAAIMLWCSTGCTAQPVKQYHNPVWDIPKLDEAGLRAYHEKRRLYLLNKEPLDLSKYQQKEGE